jgi:hypothetical protein
VPTLLIVYDLPTTKEPAVTLYAVSIASKVVPVVANVDNTSTSVSASHHFCVSKL